TAAAPSTHAPPSSPSWNRVRVSSVSPPRSWRSFWRAAADVGCGRRSVEAGGLFPAPSASTRREAWAGGHADARVLGRRHRGFGPNAGAGSAGGVGAAASLEDPVLLTNLPAQVSRFIGHETELAEVRALLDGSRLVTLTGAGGAGKTRLGVQVAAGLADGTGD